MIEQIYSGGLGLFHAHWWALAGWPVIWTLIKIVAVLVPLMGCVAYLTLWERKAIAFTQMRHGPNRIGPSGLFTPIADALKLMTKEIIVPSAASKGLFLLGPIMTNRPLGKALPKRWRRDGKRRDTGHARNPWRHVPCHFQRCALAFFPRNGAEENVALSDSRVADGGKGPVKFGVTVAHLFNRPGITISVVQGCAIGRVDLRQHHATVFYRGQFTLNFAEGYPRHDTAGDSHSHNQPAHFQRQVQQTPVAAGDGL